MALLASAAAGSAGDAAGPHRLGHFLHAQIAELTTQVADAAAVAASARAFHRGDIAVATATVRSIGR